MIIILLLTQFGKIIELSKSYRPDLEDWRTQRSHPVVEEVFSSSVIVKFN